jgi:1,4-dihydroxy-2-naphthoate octaprenyltransferase
VAVTGSAFVQSGQWHVEALIAGLQVGMLSTVLIAINNFRDVDEDTKTGKRTLAVRFGKTFARSEIAWLMGLACALGLLWLLTWELRGAKVGFPLAAIAPPGLTFWLMFGVLKDIRHDPSPALNRTLAKAGALLMAFSLALAVGFSFPYDDLTPPNPFSKEYHEQD